MLYYGIIIARNKAEITCKIDPYSFKPFYIDGIIKDSSGEVWGYTVMDRYCSIMCVDSQTFDILKRYNLIDKDCLAGLSNGVYGKKKYETFFNMPVENWKLPVYSVPGPRATFCRIVRVYDDKTELSNPNTTVYDEDIKVDNIVESYQELNETAGSSNLPTELVVSAPYIKSILAQLYPKYSIKDIAEQCGVSTSTVSRWIKQFNLK